MATRNRTFLFKKYRDALKSVRAPSSLASSSSRGGAVIELTNAGLLKQNSSYAPLSTEDPGTSSYVSSIFHLFFFPVFMKYESPFQIQTICLLIDSLGFNIK